MDSQNKSSSSDESFGVLAMPYDHFDVMLSDINELELEKIGEEEGPRHLSPATFTTPPYPVQGILHGPNYRFMVPMKFQRSRRPDSAIINVWMLYDTGSPFTCLTVKTLEKFVGVGNVVEGNYYAFAIQEQHTRVECQVSKLGTNFENVNVIGVDAMRKLKLNVEVDWDKDIFQLFKK